MLKRPFSLKFEAITTAGILSNLQMLLPRWLLAAKLQLQVIDFHNKSENAKVALTSFRLSVSFFYLSLYPAIVLLGMPHIFSDHNGL